MFYKELHKGITKDLFSGPEDGANEVTICAVHFSNAIQLSIRLNGEVDASYEVKPKGISRSVGDVGPLTLEMLEGEDGDDDESVYVDDHMSRYHITTKMGAADDQKLPVVCMQIAELYRRVIVPANLDGRAEDAPNHHMLITLSTKFWRRGGTANHAKGNDFEILVFLLQSIKEAYGLGS
ncbi:Irc25p Ecym_7107 [Eremothecium cymbalariae DBVPG|uniref:Proteasome chaperone 3 n=1 Tax=Eremothecium cymbalariae (strain CBS 270.75 / DBVPG 7215 / KCTC 17166 / NRRL Y-17582) TaxID=931890 RepID=G8JVU4_ERECY|nr:hypothetical protein Ecym_7107 [Eremothecium cymbalariae DBVPG\